MTSIVTSRGQTAIPAIIRRRYNIKAHAKLEWLDDGHKITVLPISTDPIKSLRGSVKNIDLVGALLNDRAQERVRD